MREIPELEIRSANFKRDNGYKSGRNVQRHPRIPAKTPPKESIKQERTRRRFSA